MARDRNQQIIEEIRANGGRVGGRFGGLPLLLLHHRGARSGMERVTPLAYRALEGGAMAVFATNGGASRNPDWYHNVLANPQVQVEVGGRTIGARARVADTEERERIWQQQASRLPNVDALQERSGRTIPVVILEPVEPDVRVVDNTEEQRYELWVGNTRAGVIEYVERWNGR